MSSTTAESSVPTIARIGNAHDYSNIVLGYEIQRRMPGRLGEADRGLRHARFQVLRDTPCPAVLIEIGFLSNPTDSRNLSSNWYRDRIALAIADGVCAFSDRRRLAPKVQAKGTGKREEGTGKREQGIATNALLNRLTAQPLHSSTNRLTAQPLNHSTNLSASAPSAPPRGTTNTPLNRLTAQPLNSPTNGATMRRINDATPTNAVPSVTNIANRQTVKP